MSIMLDATELTFVSGVFSIETSHLTGTSRGTKVGTSSFVRGCRSSTRGNR